MDISGVYTVTNILNGRMYIGCSGFVNGRLRRHSTDLENNRHPNDLLQRSWNMYGAENFKFELLEECPLSIMYGIEHYWVTMLNTRNKYLGFNLKPTHPENKTIRTAEMSAKIVSTRKSRGGFSWTEEGKIRQSKIISKVVRKTPIIMFNFKGEIVQEFEGLRDCERKTGIGSNGICAVLKGVQNSTSGYTFIYKQDYDPRNDYKYIPGKFYKEINK